MWFNRVKLNENEKMDKYLDLARELKKLWNMKVKVIPIVVGALGTVPINLEKRLKDMEIRRIETIQNTALLKSARILRRVMETCGDLLSLRPQSKTIIKLTIHENGICIDQNPFLRI